MHLKNCPNNVRLFSGMRSDEIASVLKLSVRTVENQLYRGLKLIRQSLDDYLTILILLFVDNLFK